MKTLMCIGGAYDGMIIAAEDSGFVVHHTASLPAIMPHYTPAPGDKVEVEVKRDVYRARYLLGTTRDVFEFWWPDSLNDRRVDPVALLINNYRPQKGRPL